MSEALFDKKPTQKADDSIFKEKSTTTKKSNKGLHPFTLTPTSAKI